MIVTERRRRLSVRCVSIYSAEKLRSGLFGVNDCQLRDLRMPSFNYALTNLEFRGELIRHRDGSMTSSEIRFVVNGASCILTQQASQQQLKELADDEGSAVTAFLRLESANDLNAESADRIADSICDLLTLARTNTVQWIHRSELDNQGRDVGGKSEARRLLSFQRGFDLIPQQYQIDDVRRPLLDLLNCTARHMAIRDKLINATQLLLESERHAYLEIRFVLVYMAAERLREVLRDENEEPDPRISKLWSAKLRNPIGERVINVVQNELGQISDDAKDSIRTHLGNANRPHMVDELGAVFEKYNIQGFRREMVKLRNALVHSGDVRDFTDLEHRDELQVDLSHLVSVCLLKAVGYTGYYQHRARGNAVPQLVP